MKPSWREDLTSILAIGAGAFVSSVLTAATLFVGAGDRGPDAQVRVWVEHEVTHAVHESHQMAGPEGAHSGWFPEDVSVEVLAEPRIHLESSRSHITLHRVK